VDSQDTGPSNREKLSKFVLRLKGKTRAEFAALMNVPILVQVTEPGGSDVAAVEPSVPKFGTMHMNKEQLVFADTGLYAFPLRKSATNAFAMMVTVGRAANNDIVLPYEAISKFHAYFSSTPQGWVLTDAKSTNGTYVGAKKLDQDAKEKLDLSSGRLELSFSTSIRCQLYTPEGFYDETKDLLDKLERPGRK
jgi:hypothetical protein